MPPQPVEWVLVVFYGPSAHRATYGRLSNTKYTKDYIQLSRRPDFLDAITRLFPVSGGSGTFPLTYQWPAGSSPGAVVFESADRPHLMWGTSVGAPKAWKMAETPTETTAETIPGDPSHTEFAAAENEMALLSARGAGQPYLVAVKLRDDPNRLHLRTYLKGPAASFAWADVTLTPAEIQSLASRTSRSSALAWANLPSGGVAPSEFVTETLARITAAGDATSTLDHLDPPAARALADYLRHPGYGLFFDPAKNHDAWSTPLALPDAVSSVAAHLVEMLDERFPPMSDGDVAAEALDSDPNEVAAFRERIAESSFEVPDTTVTAKTRGSAQKAFAEAVKRNYGYRCAITGIGTREFLVAAHIVPWSRDQTIRLDPSNGICLSLIVDRAFEKGFIVVDDDLTIRVDRSRIGEDAALLIQLGQLEGQRLCLPQADPPNVSYLQRRRAMVERAESGG